MTAPPFAAAPVVAVKCGSSWRSAAVRVERFSGNWFGNGSRRPAGTFVEERRADPKQICFGVGSVQISPVASQRFGKKVMESKARVVPFYPTPTARGRAQNPPFPRQGCLEISRCRTTRWSPTLDRSLPSLPLRSLAVKRGSARRCIAGSRFSVRGNRTNGVGRSRGWPLRGIGSWALRFGYLIGGFG